MTKFDDIVNFLKSHKVDFELIEHEPALTSAQAELITGWPSASGAKALVFKVDEEFILCVVKGSNTVDFNKLRKHFGVRKARLATPDEVYAVMGVRIGACYPFPKIAGIRGIVDDSLKSVETISFSPGRAENHIRMKQSDYVKITQPEFVDIAK